MGSEVKSSAVLDRIDDVLKKLEAAYSPVFVNGKKYPGNNSFVLNKINNLLVAGILKQSDIKIDGKIVKYYDKETILNDRVEDIFNEICKECEYLVDKRMEGNL